MAEKLPIWILLTSDFAGFYVGQVGAGLVDWGFEERRFKGDVP